MKTDDFDYTLPPELIAQTPAEVRDACRLLVLNKRSGALQDCVFHDIGTFLHPGDLLAVSYTHLTLPTKA